MLGALKRVTIPFTAVRKGEWRGKGFGLGHDPKGKVFGVLGMGGIGQACAARAKPFGMSIQYHNRNRLPPEQEQGAKYVSFEELLKTSDVLSLNLALNANTRHIISTPQFEMMKDGIVIINTARGPIIDEAALVEAMKSGKVSAVGLDVFEEEPKIRPGLLDNPNAVLLPHIGTSTWETQRDMELLVLENLKSAVEGKGLVTGVPEQRGLEHHTTATMLGRLKQSLRPCRLLKLPAELRNNIWRQACEPWDSESLAETPPPNLDISGLARNSTFRRPRPSITRTCREIREEALSLFYAFGTFVIHSPLSFVPEAQLEAPAETWFKAIGKRIHHLEQITLVTHLPWNLHFCLAIIKLTIVKGDIKFQVICLRHHNDDDDKGYVTQRSSRADEQSTLLEAAFAKPALTRSARIKARSPGFDAHEWVSILQRLVHSIEKMNTIINYLDIIVSSPGDVLSPYP
ncbi:uncharacterized protein LTR77_005138 [Saxophila tyrrhenica]|uniref:D-isomer specific 2-hydroxyacid dehydrogenase NAD-binding domain-containing protein n=1 Tax=Saxophila tyrrhenica TaxID=1690608 RepID=A0AAV9PFF6_9PEZI|nr:hypothetical protein LTR77_005138 [Saxophila tyrrhenica]